MAKQSRASAHDVAVSAPELSGPGGAPRPLTNAFTLGEPLDHMAAHPDLDAAHRSWLAFEGDGAPQPGRRGIRVTLGRLASRIFVHEPTIAHHHALLSELTRIVDALAKRCDELDRRLGLLHEQLGEVTAVLGDDLTRLSAMVASEQRESPEPDGG